MAHAESPGHASRWLRVATAVWFLLLLGFAVWTREPMRREGLWRDEAISVYVSQAPSLSELIGRNRVADYNPPLFNLALAAYSRVAGSEEGEVKLFALILGLLTAAGCALLAGEMGGPIAAVLAAALAIHNPILLEMATEVRPYSLSALLCVVSLFLVSRLRRDPGAGLGPFLVFAALVLLVYAHLAGGVVAAVLFGWGVLAWRRDPASAFGKKLAVSAGLAGASFLFWLPTTWRQVRTGIPWEYSLPLTENFRLLLLRSRDVLPIPGAFGQPLFYVGIGTVCAIGVLQAPRVAALLRRQGGLVAVTAVAGVAVWLFLGLFSRQVRYLIIPAALAGVLFAVVVGRVVEVGWGSRPAVRVTASVGLAGLLMASFSARADWYEERARTALSIPKSGIRTFCRSPGSGELLVVAPDYLAPTVWYYCGRDEDTHGFVRWDRPTLFDPGSYAELWNDPAAASRTISRIEDLLRRQGRSRFTLLLDDPPGGVLPLYGPQIVRFEAALAARFDAKPEHRFEGRLEFVDVFVMSSR